VGEQKRKAQDPGRLGDLAVDVPSVPLSPVLAEGFAVVGGEDHEGARAKSANVELVHETAEEPVHPSDGIVVDVRVRRAEDRFLLGGDVLVHVHEVHVEEPAFVFVGAQERQGGADDIRIRSGERQVGVLPTATSLQRGRRRLLVDFEALGEAEVRGDPAVPPYPRRSHPRLPE